MADQNKNVTASPPTNPTEVGEKPKIPVEIHPALVDSARAQEILNQKNDLMKKIQEETKEQLKSGLPTSEKTPDSKLVAGTKAALVATTLATSGLAQEALKPKVQPAPEVQLTPTEKVTEEELFTLAKYRDRDRLERWPTLTPEQKGRVLHYFALGKKMNLDERGMKRL
jgi:hypothetical protein